MKGDSPISVSDGIKLINYGCFGNIKRNRERFEAVFGVNNCVGKHRKRAGSQEVTLDMIYDLIEIAKKYAEKLNATKEQLKDYFNQLKNTFQETLEGMQKIWIVIVDKSGMRRYIDPDTEDVNEGKGKRWISRFSYIDFEKEYLCEKINKIKETLNKKLKN
jgi:hypothetical protein